MSRLMPRSFFSRLLLSFLLVFVIAGVVLITATEISLPRLYDRHFGMMAEDGSMNPSMMGEHGRGSGGGQQVLYLNFRAAVQGALLPAAGAALLAAILISAWLSRRVSRPLHQLTAISQRIAAGHYGERLAEGQDAPEEVETLAHSFNQMAARLESTETLRRELIADVSHELRTPLTIIKGSMEGLMDGVLTADNQAFSLIHAEAARLERLVNDLLQLSRLEAGNDTLEKSVLKVDTLLQGSAEGMATAFLAKDVTLESELPPDLPDLYVDADRAYQAVLNLLNNALEYTPSGGRVWLRAKSDGKQVRIEVEDTGIGISADHLPHVFERFYRVDKSRSRAHGGTGIGLAIVRRIMEAHGGEVQATSPGEGKGSQFTLIWPVVAAPPG